MTRATTQRPTIAQPVASPIAHPAACAPNTGTSSANSCASNPICANRPIAMPAASV
jgi:hypothetical protein